MKYELHEKGGRRLIRTYTNPERLPFFIGFYFDEALAEPVAEWQKNARVGDIYDHELFYVVVKNKE